MAYQNLGYEVDQAVAVLTIDRPEALNALNRATMAELHEALRQLRGDEAVRAVVLTGAGEKAFVAGADIAEMSAMDSREAQSFARMGTALGSEMESLPKPIIAAVNGFALGGGCELAMCCDFIIASDRARFGQPEVNLGLIPGFGGTQRLTRLVGRATARRLLYSGELISAARALEIGLVTQVVAPDELMETALSLARLIATKGPLAVAAAKEAINMGADGSLEDGLEREAQLFGSLFDTNDMREGTSAFVEKRAAEFTGT